MLILTKSSYSLLSLFLSLRARLTRRAAALESKLRRDSLASSLSSSELVDRPIGPEHRAKSVSWDPGSVLGLSEISR